MIADVDLEMQVWTGGLALVSNLGDRLAYLDLLAGLNEVPVVVPVGRDHAARVLDADPESVTAGRSGVDHSAAARGDNRGTDGRGDVLTTVKLSAA